MTSRIAAAIRWRINAAEMWWDGFLAHRGPRVFIALHWPWPFKKPWQRRRLTVTTAGGIGDELMAATVCAEIKRRNPSCSIRFVSRYPEMFEGVVDEVERHDPARTRRALLLKYHHVIPPPRPLVTLMAECAGLEFRTPKLIAPRVSASEALQAEIECVPRPRIAVQPISSKWTPNKTWPVEHWRALLSQLSTLGHVIELGTETMFPNRRTEFGERYHSFAGRTSPAEFGWIISKCDLFIGPSSGGMHLANAFGIPSLIIFGGYESPDGYNYPSTNFYTPVECAPCWLTTNCPYGWKCLHAISPEAVFGAARNAIEMKSQSAS